MDDQDGIVINLSWGNAKSETTEYAEVSNEKSGQLLAKRNTTGKANKLILLNRFECLSSKEGESMPSPKDAEISLSTKLNNGERSVGSANVRKPQKEYSMKPQIIPDNQTSNDITEI